jgi:predicted nucleic acid-binding protein
VWIIDSNVYIRAFNDARFGAELTRFHAAHLPRIVLSAVVVFELLAGCRTVPAERRLRRGLVEPYRKRGRLHVPTQETWEAAADLDRRLRGRRGSASLDERALSNDLLVAASARQLGATIVSENEAEFARIGRLIDVEHALPWP